MAQSQAQYCYQKKRKSRPFASGNIGHRRPGQSNFRTRSDVTSFPTKAPLISSSPFLFPYSLVGSSLLTSPSSWKLNLVPSLSGLDILSQKHGAFKSYPWEQTYRPFPLVASLQGHIHPPSISLTGTGQSLALVPAGHRDYRKTSTKDLQ